MRVVGENVEVGVYHITQAMKMAKEQELDLVEISPPFDQSGGTAFLGSSILFEILCILASK